MKGEDISERLIDFAVRIIQLAASLPRTYIGRHIAGEIVRSGTSTGANYEEARGAESLNDFIHKVGVALKELRETIYWLKIIKRTKMISPKRMGNLLSEADELCAIFVSSVVTAKKKRT